MKTIVKEIAALSLWMKMLQSKPIWHFYENVISLVNSLHQLS